jgi:hypothetical protein
MGYRMSTDNVVMCYNMLNLLAVGELMHLSNEQIQRIKVALNHVT